MAESAPSQISGDDIISELIRNVEAGRFRVGNITLLPCIFNVYLHEQDFELIRPIAGVIRGEAIKALTEHVSRMNKPRTQFMKRLGLVTDVQPQHKILEPEWTIQFHRGEDERLRRGEIEIYSDLGTSEKTEAGSGSMTTLITHSSRGKSPAQDANAGDSPNLPAFALLRYRDSAGDKAFAMTREETVVGRGGKAVWVDLKLEGPSDISREHCRIRRDASTGRFYIKDLSQYGTTVDGTRIPSSVERNERGDKVDRNVEVPLPGRAKIGLADVLVLEFEAKRPE